MNYKEEYMRCLQDKTRQYFIEHYLSTFNADERKEVPFKLFPRQIELLKSFVRYNNTISVKHRQAGITTVASGWITGQCVFASKNSPETVLCIGNKLDISEQLVEKIGNFLDQVPRWMWGSEYYSPDPDNPKNRKSIYKARNKQRIELFNGCKIYARSSGEHAARGISAVSILVFDEAAFIQNGVSVYSSSVAATSSVKDAKILMISTPNGKDQLYYRTYSKALKGENNYHPVEFKWFQDLRYNKNLKWYRKNPDNGLIEWEYDTIIDDNGSVKYDEERWRKLERDGWTPTSPWFEDMCKSFNNDEQKIAQELLVSFLGSSDNVISPDTIDMQMKQNVIQLPEDWKLKDPFVKETWIWKDPVPGHRYICACLPKGEDVLTENGLVKIENVSFTNNLYNKDGRPTNIRRIIQREYKGEIYSIKLKNIIDPIRFTSEHPIWSSIKPKLVRRKNKKCGIDKRERLFSFKFNNAECLNVGDWIEFPNLYRYNILNNEQILEKWIEGQDLTVRRDYIIDNPLLEEEFWWFCGIWLAEGFVNNSSKKYMTITTTHHINEVNIHNRIKQLCFNLFGRKANVTYNVNEHSCIIRFNSKQIGSFLTNNFGKYAQNKHIPEWVKHIPVKLKKRLIEGYLNGDGCINKDNSSDYVSVSKKLLNDIQDILFSLGVVSSLKKHNDEYEGVVCGKKCRCQTKYILHSGFHDTKKLLDLIGVENSIQLKEGRRKISNCYLSDDENKIYIQISKIERSLYDGVVFNFETEDHTFCNRYIASHNCDPSSGAADDRTAIEIIDVDAVDRNGVPCFEQVLEYQGKRTGDEIGEMVNEYALSYNTALVVVECIGGYGDATVLALQRMRYPNLYYEQPALKTYTIERAYSKFNLKQGDQLPGFRNNGLRMQMIQNFVTLVKENALRIRSMRVITEMETWVWKNGRPDHMDGMHDDTLTCLAMGTFVMQYYMLKNEKTKARDAAIASSWRVNTNVNNYTRNDHDNVNIANNKAMPFFSSVQMNKESQMRLNAMLLMGGVKAKYLR